MVNKKCLFILLLGTILLLSGCANCYFGNYGERDDVQHFIHKVSARDHFDSQKLTAIFNQVNPDNMIVKSEKKPHEQTMTWNRYRARLITPEHIERGAVFWSAHFDTLQLAQQKYGVDPAIIIGILGVETDYGKYLGKFRAIDALSTLAFDYPRREHYFQYELEQYLLLTRDLERDPLSFPSSYAGALGLPQFMPSNYRHLAVSKNGKSPDLFNNADDVILSIANYFHHSGWQPNQAITLQVSNCNNTLKLGNECWQIYPNFLVIKRYNNSNFYAMTVYQLGQAVKNRKFT
jgi:membrane-bound lytic murein transglycosylase B